MLNNSVKLFCHEYVKRNIPCPDSPGSNGVEHLFWVRCSDYVENAGLCYEFVKINPRVVKINNEDPENISRDMINTDIKVTLAKSPEKFATLNSGIEIIAENVRTEKDAKGHFVLFDLSDINSHGVINGNHTQRLIRSFYNDACNEIKDNSEFPLTDEEAIIEARKRLRTAFVSVKILEKACDSTEISEIAAAKNRHHPIKESSLANLEGKFDTIKKVLQKNNVLGDIRWKQNESAKIPVEKVIQYIMLFDVVRYINISQYDFGKERKLAPDEMKIFQQPQGAYSSTETILNKFLSILSDKKPDDYEGLSDEEVKRKDEEIRVLNILQENVFEILEISDKVSKRIDLFPNIGRLDRVDRGDGKKQEEKDIPLRFWKKGKTTSLKHRQATWEAFKMPFMSALRANIDVKQMKQGKLKWHIPIDALLDAVSTQIVSDCYDSYKKDNIKRFEFAKKADFYKICFGYVKEEILSRGINITV